MARTTISAWFAPEFVSHFKASAIFNGIGVSKKQEATRCLPRHFDDTLVIFRSILRATSRPSLFADGHLNGSRLPPRNGRSRPQNYRPASRCRNADNFVRARKGGTARCNVPCSWPELGPKQETNLSHVSGLAGCLQQSKN
jgi:hypothetical protein